MDPYPLWDDAATWDRSSAVIVSVPHFSRNDFLEPRLKPEGEYLGAALLSFVQGVGNDFLVNEILQTYELKSIDPDTWYGLHIAQSIYRDVGRSIGAASLRAVGEAIIEKAKFPPGIDSPQAALASIDAAYRLNVRGENLGRITHRATGSNGAELEFSTPFPCNLDQGIMRGCCKKFGAYARIEHGVGGCRDKGGASCKYTAFWNA